MTDKAEAIAQLSGDTQERLPPIELTMDTPLMEMLGEAAELGGIFGQSFGLQLEEGGTAPMPMAVVVVAVGERALQLDAVMRDHMGAFHVTPGTDNPIPSPLSDAAIATLIAEHAALLLERDKYMAIANRSISSEVLIEAIQPARELLAQFRGHARNEGIGNQDAIEAAMEKLQWVREQSMVQAAPPTF